MGAPKGNQFWKLRSKHGRDKIFETADILWDAACDYFEWIDNNPLIEEKVVPSKHTTEVVKLKKMRPYTISGLAIYCDADSAYFNNFRNRLDPKIKEHKEFLAVLSRIYEIIYTQKFEGAAVNLFNHNIIARDLGLVDKKEEKQDVSVELKDAVVEYRVD